MAPSKRPWDLCLRSDRRGGDAVAILSHGFWQREFAGDPGVGRTVNLDGNPFTIVGVTPRDFFGVRVGFTFDVMIPLGSEPIIRGVDSALDRRSTWWLSMFGRLAPGQTMAAGRSAARGAAAATA